MGNELGKYANLYWSLNSKETWIRLRWADGKVLYEIRWYISGSFWEQKTILYEEGQQWGNPKEIQTLEWSDCWFLSRNVPTMYRRCTKNKSKSIDGRCRSQSVWLYFRSCAKDRVMFCSAWTNLYLTSEGERKSNIEEWSNEGSKENWYLIWAISRQRCKEIYRCT